MNRFQSLIAMTVLFSMPVVCVAQEDDVTMEVIESLDDLTVHHRIRLPSRAVSQDALDMAVGKMVTNQHGRDVRDVRQKLQLDNKLNEFRIEIEEVPETTGVSKRGKLREDRTEIVTDQKIESRNAKRSIASFKKELTDRRKELLDELKESQGEEPTAIMVLPESKALH